jgi:hypothetical protein
MCYQIATIDGIHAANTTSACALARTEITRYSESLAALEYNYARYVAAILYIIRATEARRRPIRSLATAATEARAVVAP